MLVVLVAGGTIAVARGSDSIGPILTFVGAILVALITAYTTNRRQQTQLKAEERRQATQLAHDRRMRDLEHLRVVLSEAAVAYDDVILALARFENEPSETAIGVDPHAAFRTAASHMSRLQLWLPGEGAIVTHYTSALGALDGVLKILDESPRPLTGQAAAQRYELTGRAGSSWNAFVEAAVALVGALLPNEERAVQAGQHTRSRTPLTSAEDIRSREA